jgi:transcription elongation factor SPT6
VYTYCFIFLICQGPDRLTLSWKVAPDIYSHVDIKEERKENAFSLGKTLYIGNEEFEDLDEIIGK